MEALVEACAIQGRTYCIYAYIRSAPKRNNHIKHYHVGALNGDFESIPQSPYFSTARASLLCKWTGPLRTKNLLRNSSAKWVLDWQRNEVQLRGQTSTAFWNLKKPWTIELIIEWNSKIDRYWSRGCRWTNKGNSWHSSFETSKEACNVFELEGKAQICIGIGVEGSHYHNFRAREPIKSMKTY